MMAMELSLQSCNGNGHKPTASEILGRLAREVDGFLTSRIGGESFITLLLPSTMSMKNPS